VSEHLSMDEARYLPIEARTDELNLLEAYVKENDGYVDEAAIRRHIIARRALIVAMATRPADAEPEPPKPETSIYGRTVNQWHRFLTGENLDVPSSRYGRNASEVAWWAIASIIIYNEYAGEPDEIDEFADNAMSMVVNDHASTGPFVREHAHLLPPEVLDHLDWEALDE